MANGEKHGQQTIGRQMVLPLSKALEISFRGIRVRLWRSLITMSGVVLATAFVVSVLASGAVTRAVAADGSARAVRLLQEIGIDPSEMAEVNATNKWLAVMSMLVCVVGIVMSMLMSVSERYQEIGTMKCLGALDSFIVKIFLLESGFQGIIGSVIGACVGFVTSVVSARMHFGEVLRGNWPVSSMLRSSGFVVLLGSILAILAAIYPAYIAAKMEPAAAMRVEE